MSSMWNVNEHSVAIDGYDVVAYFDKHEAIRGSSDFQAAHDGATFYFENDSHRQAFLAGPSKYLPKFGGWCAFAVGAKKAKVKADPRTFKIYHGELLLFFNDYYEGKPFNTIVPWNQDEQAMYATAETSWPQID